MGCQRDISQTIIDKKADYILALKGDQGTLQRRVKLFVDEQKAVGFQGRRPRSASDKTVDGDHGRIETREDHCHSMMSNGYRRRHDWPGLRRRSSWSRATREVGDKIDREMRLYITSLVLLAHPDRTDGPRPLDDRKCAAGARKGGSYELTDRAQAA